MFAFHNFTLVSPLYVYCVAVNYDRHENHVFERIFVFVPIPSGLISKIISVFWFY